MLEVPEDVAQDLSGEDRLGPGLVGVEIADPETAVDVVIAGAAITATVAGQEAGAAVLLRRRLGDVVLVEGEMDESAALEGRERLARRAAIMAILLRGPCAGSRPSGCSPTTNDAAAAHQRAE
jgi:hypothetical protein